MLGVALAESGDREAGRTMLIRSMAALARSQAAGDPLMVQMRDWADRLERNSAGRGG